ncbi:MAG: DUF4249 domain-containing protein [Saprospiraceae bacterium]|nr:DUF4249 domain-containing protein [Saprospiraceae bacterium]
MKQLLFIFFALFAFAGCNGDFFDSEIELPTPEHDPVLAISGFITSTDQDFIAVKVTRTYGLFEERPYDDRIFDATVELFEDDNLLYTFDTIDFQEANYYQLLQEPFGGFGKNYELRVSHPDLGTATAKQTMLQPVPLSEITFNPIASNDFSGTDGEFKIVLNDPPNEENFYELVAQKVCTYTYIDYYGNEITEEYPETIYFDMDMTSNPNITQGYNYEAILLSDKNFDGQTFTFRPKFYTCGGHLDQETTFTVYWRTVTKDYFNYSKSLFDTEMAQNNPFAEPVSLYTNVDGGVGGFCMRSELVYEVE